MSCADVLRDYEDDQGAFAINKGNWSKHNVPKSKRLESQYLHRINLGDVHDCRGNKLSMSRSMKKNIDRTETAAHESRRIRKKDKKDRATTEMVLDHRTKTVLYGMLSKTLIHSIHGCISTGKEANVYYSIDEYGTEFGLKIYKTSVLSFKDRARYVRGEHRFDRGYSRNPRKMVQLWAEKEFRNLHRIYNAFIPSPRPVYVRQNVLLMKLVGSDGVAAPRLKDYKFECEEEKYRCYLQIIKYMRLMYWKCSLVHGDLSEYNILYYQGLPYIIDVSQSVEPAHPNSYEFLAKDCKNVNEFFRKQAIMTLTDLELFEYVLDERHVKTDGDAERKTEQKQKQKRKQNQKQKQQQRENEKNDEEAKVIEHEFGAHHESWNDVIDKQVIQKIETICKERWEDMSTEHEDEEKEVMDAVHLKSKIMRSLFDIDDLAQIHQNKEKFEQIAKFLLKDSGEMLQMDKFMEQDEEDIDGMDYKEDSEEEDSEEEEDESESEEEMAVTMFPLTPQEALYHKEEMSKEELKEMRKANKKIVKAANREKRKHKMPKKVKKRKIKVARIKAGKSVWKG